MKMNDANVIAHQARKIAELEVGLRLHSEGERQLLAILESSGISVTQMELSPEEAEFLDNYRRATPAGKATIRAEIEKQVVATKERKDALAQESAGKEGAPKKARRGEPDEPGAAVTILPAEFVKRSSEE